MRCAWQAYLSLIPATMRCEVDSRGRGKLQELRMRLNRPAELVCSDGLLYLEHTVTPSDLSYSINMACEYSPWTASTTDQCYITAPGGHRIGICGVVAADTGRIQGLRELTSISIRVARDIPVFEGDTNSHESVLILGRPGAGKTTMLRDLVRYRSDAFYETICVVDERAEIFPIAKGAFCFPTGKRVDVLTGRSKQEGILQLLRTMTPNTIAVDEVTAAEDCEALLNAAWCGVHLIASAHADSVEGFKQRNVYKPLVESGVFQRAIVLRKDRSWYWEKL